MCGQWRAVRPASVSTVEVEPGTIVCCHFPSVRFWHCDDAVGGLRRLRAKRGRDAYLAGTCGPRGRHAEELSDAAARFLGWRPNMPLGRGRCTPTKPQSVPDTRRAIVTDDRHLLDLGQYGTVQVLSPAGFLAFPELR
jgi:hypothetical protein